MDGMRHGRGVYKYADGNTYTGEIIVDHTLDFTIHSILLIFRSGRFTNGTFSGKGRFVWTTGEKYEGQWQDNKQHGEVQDCTPFP
jgi:hypothetical protein